MPDHYTTHYTTVDLATQAAAKMMTRSKTHEAAENFSPNIVGRKKIMEKHASIESVMKLEEFNCMNSSDNENNCSLDDNFNIPFTSLTTDSGVTEDFQDAESALQASENIQPDANSTMSGSDSTLLLASVTGLTREAVETTAGDQHAPNTKAMDDSMTVATIATKPTTDAMDGTMPVVTASMEPTIKATDGTMPVATATTEPTIKATDGTMATAINEPTIEATKPTTDARDGTMAVAVATAATDQPSKQQMALCK